MPRRHRTCDTLRASLRSLMRLAPPQIQVYPSYNYTNSNIPRSGGRELRIRR